MMRWTARLTCIGVLLVAVQAYGDPGQPGRLAVGARAGLTLATFTGPGASNEYVSSAVAPGFSAGGMVGLRLHELFAVHAEVLYTRKGTRATINDMAFGTYMANYLEVPVLVAATLPLGGRVRYHAAAGLSLGYRLAVKVARPDGEILDLTDRFEPMELGWMVAAGLSVPTPGHGAVIAEVRLGAGLSNIDKTGADTDEVKNRALYFMLGYQR